ncbi:MAG: hypothetical protein WDW36_008187 [Sanguina aurantia]
MLATARRVYWLPASLLAAAAAAPLSFTSQSLSAEAEAPAQGALDPTQFKPFKLISKQVLTTNTAQYRFEIPAGQVAGLPVASCLVTKAMLVQKEGEAAKATIRPYTPTSPPHARGYFDLVVKVYPTGIMSKHFDSLKVGDMLEMKGPILKYPYEPNSKKSIGLLAGGTGITPMLQLIDAVLSNPDDRTELSLIFANNSEDDIILRNHIDNLAKTHKNFKVYYVVSKPNYAGAFWMGGVGNVTSDMIKKHLPAPAGDSHVFVCGPPGFMNAMSGNKTSPKDQGELVGSLKELGYKAENVYKF